MTITLVENKPKNRVLDQDTIQKVIQASAEGKPQTVIAKEVGVSQNAISKHLNKPEAKALTEKLREVLQKKHTTRFIARKIKEEQHASNLSDYALGLTDDNPTRYETPEQQEKFLNRIDKTGIAIAKGVGILDTNTIHFGDNNIVNNQVISPAFQQFIDFQSKNGYEDDENNENNA